VVVGGIRQTKSAVPAVKKSVEQRRYRRTREHGPQTLTVVYTEADGKSKQCKAKLWDFSDGGLGMDSPRAFQPGDVIHIQGAMRGPAYSMQLDAQARVAYCRKVDNDSYRVGVAFLEVAYHRLPN
jgi:c-di-GMP-binding flagellar brake protein YcgR